MFTAHERTRWEPAVENMSATQTQKRIVDFFSGGNSAKQAKTQQSGETSGEKSADEKAGKSYVKKFQTEWLQKPPFHWLRYDDAKKLMTYGICIQQNETNAVTQGTDNFRTSTLEHHAESF